MDLALTEEQGAIFETAGAAAHGDVLEGIRAAIVERDRAPRRRRPSPEAVGAIEVSAMLKLLGEGALKLEERA